MESNQEKKSAPNKETSSRPQNCPPTVESIPNPRGTISGSSLGEGGGITCAPASGFQEHNLPLTTGHQGPSLETQGLRPTLEMAPFTPDTIREGGRASPCAGGAYSGVGAGKDRTAHSAKCPDGEAQGYPAQTGQQGSVLLEKKVVKLRPKGCPEVSGFLKGDKN